MGELSIKVLLVDDEVDALELPSHILEEFGIPSVIANSLEKAWALLTESPESFCYVLCDLNIAEGQSGLDLRRRMLKDTPMMCNISFAIYSGYLSTKVLTEAIDCKVDKFIDKPADIDKLNQIINENIKPAFEMVTERVMLRATFLEESSDLIADVEPLILELEQSPDDMELVNGIFRLVHTMKGGSGVLDLPEFTKFLHLYEDLFSQIKKGRVKLNQDIVDLILSATDHLRGYLEQFNRFACPNIDIEAWKQSFTVGLQNNHRSPPAESLNRDESKATAIAPGPMDDKAEDSIRIPTCVLDTLLEFSGEITVLRNTINRIVSSIEKEMQGKKSIVSLREFLDEMHKINSQIQAKVMDLRRVPLSTVYSALPRTVRDLKSHLKKDFKLQIKGEALKIDTKIAKVLKGSIIHILRNSADHGLEEKQVRIDAGKPETGSIDITSELIDDSVVVEIEDDGAGINKDAVLSKAIENGLIVAENAHSLSDSHIYSLILEAGFSTASSVTEVSGRGVGMDMVKNSVNSVGGSIGINSHKGKGTKFTLTMPVPRSVIIMDSLLVETKGRVFSLPQEGIVRILRVERKDYDRYIRELEGARILSIDEELIPLAKLSQVLNLQGPQEIQDITNIVVVRGRYLQKIGIFVDDIKDFEEIVVKEIPEYVNRLNLFVGATFMGDGSVGLILDVDGILSSMAHQTTKEPATNIRDSQNSMEMVVDNGTEYVLFQLFDDSIYGLPLEEVFRLEELDIDQVRRSGIGDSFIFRDHVVPLLQIEGQRAIKEYMPKGGGHRLALIIVCHSERNFALLTRGIVDIIRTDADVNDYHSYDWIAGKILSGQRIISLVDMDYVLRKCQSSWEN